MNLPATDNFAPEDGWSRRRWMGILLLAVLLHVGIVFLTGSKKSPAVRTVTNDPQIRLTPDNSQLIALSDPTLFVFPHESLDGYPAEWQRPPAIRSPQFNWHEAPIFLPADQEKWGGNLTNYLQLNRYQGPSMNLKPESKLDSVSIQARTIQSDKSTIQFAGGLIKRELAKPATIPALPINDVLSPSRVQVIVDDSGTVISVILVESSESDTADQRALELSRAMKFKPDGGTTLGEIIFRWQTLPTTTP